MFIGAYVRTIINFEMIKELFDYYTLEEIKLFIKSKTSMNLADEDYGQTSPRDFGRLDSIPYLRTAYGAALGIVGDQYSKANLKDETIFACEYICNDIKQNNFVTYSVFDGIIAMFCLYS